MPEIHHCEECGAPLSSRKVKIGNEEHEELFCPDVERKKDKHPLARAVQRVNDLRHPGRGHA